MRLDLNGKSINAVANGSCSNGGVTHFIRVKSGGDLTITDTSDDKSGCITATYGANSVLEVIEIMSDIIQIGYFKMTHGKRIFKMAPIHHHFEMSGWKENKIVVVFSLINLLGGAVGVWLMNSMK